MWLAYSFFFALWTSIGIVILKRLTIEIKPVPLIVITNLFTIPFMFLFFIYLKIPQTSIDFYKFILAASILDSIAAIAYYKALTSSPISLISPISSFNPVFTLIFASLFLNEKPTILKLAGIIIIVFGSYLLNITDIKSGILKPFTRLLSHKGVQLFLLANLIWGLTPILQKQAIFLTNPHVPIFAAVSEGILVTLILLPFAIRNKVTRVPIRKNLKWFLILGPMTALATFAAFEAFSLTNLGYVTAVFKLSTLFTVILGALFFNEKRIRERVLGASVMVAGTILLAV